jgi:UDP:flavonoid glycosyltransferase YjiC (YdhE family)
MGRFLFVAPPLPASTLPAVAVGTALEARGHAVAWAGDPGLAGLLPPATPFFPVDADGRPILAQRGPDELRGPAGLRFHWEEYLLPLARHMLPGVQAAARTWDADVLVADQPALAGAATAHRLGLPWATTITTAAEVTDPVGNLPLVTRWIRGLLRDLAAGDVDLRLSPYAVVAFSTPELLADAGLPAHTTYAGPGVAVAPSPSTVDGPVVVVGPDRDGFRELVLEALGTLDVQAVLVGSAPNPDDPVLRRAALVVDHGDHLNVCAALAAGVPVVVAPIADDQPVMAQHVVAAGAGLRVAMGRLDAAGLRDALSRALSDEELVAGAVRARDSFLRAGGHALAADRIEGLLGAQPMTSAGPPSAQQVPA